MDDIYQFSKNFSLRIDEVEEVRWTPLGKVPPFSPGRTSGVLGPSSKETHLCVKFEGVFLADRC